ncbi:MAG: aminomethyl-transferring glycine dehydrogenase subunit GcvPA [Magnetococcales bacterium]|nr:aminomethyl-transferring glycine dehydrogenase subunit GcvPA [Magnetococcales bacterium]
MPFIPHTTQDVEAMLATIGVSALDDLFCEIPANLRCDPPKLLPALNEMEITRLMAQRSAQDGGMLGFLGAGAYDHHIPAAVWEITTRGEYYSAYTPYQAEASQGTLQVIYEFQSMIAGLTAMEVSNASLYDGASGAAEAVLMAVRCSRKKTACIAIPATVNPRTIATIRTLISQQGIELLEIACTAQNGRIDPATLAQYNAKDILALLIPQPNYFGLLEDVDLLTDWAHAQGALVVGIVNPLALGILKPPGEWGSQGADIACGEGQPLGIPLSSGGPYFGFFACKKQWLRQLPGRIVGRTQDREGKRGFVLTMQAREQHIRRSKATSNICTNQGLMTVAATIYMAIMGPTGLANVAYACHDNSRKLLEQLTAIPGVERLHSGHYFHEFVVKLDRDVAKVLEELLAVGIVGGLALADNCMLVCVTETKTQADLDSYKAALADIMLRSDS